MVELVYIVEDDPMVVDMYIELLRRNKMEVVGWAFDGEEAVRKYPQLSRRPDVIIMDYRLPIKNGIEATKEIMNLDPSARVLFVSADVTSKEPAMQNGARGFIRKPFEIKEFISAVRELAHQGSG